MPFEPVPTTTALSATSLTYNGSTPLFAAYGSSNVPQPTSELISPVLVRSDNESKTAYIEVDDTTGKLSFTTPTNGTMQLTAGNGFILMTNGNGAGPTFAIDNDGDLSITSTKSMALYPAYQDPTNNVSVGLGNVLFPPNQGTSNASLTVDNSGNCTITAANDLVIKPGPFQGAEVTIGLGKVRFGAATGGQYTEVQTDVQGDTTISSQGTVKFQLYSGESVGLTKADGAFGTFYDTVYNTLPVLPVLQVLASSPEGAVGNIQYSNSSVAVTAGGIYQLQLTGEGVTTIPSTYLSLGALNASGTGSVIDFSGTTLAATSVSGATLQLASNYFTAPTNPIRVSLASSDPTNQWTGTWSLQLVQIR